MNGLSPISTSIIGKSKSTLDNKSEQTKLKLNIKDK